MQSIAFTDPEEFEAGVNPVAGSVRARPASGSKLSGQIWVAGFQRVGFLAINSDPFAVSIDRAAGFYGLTIAQGAAFAVSKGRQIRTFSRESAHLLTPDNAVNFRTNHRADILGTNFFVDDLEEYALRLDGDTDTFHLPRDYRVSMATSAGAGLERYLTFIWNELNRGGGILNSNLVAKELEDGLLAALVFAICETGPASNPAKLDHSDARISRAEEYLAAHLCEPISRALLAETAGVSIRSLSRGFLKRHGVGPMTFLKQRRLDAARAKLLAAEPGSTSVSETALLYGFSELSKFSASYKATFGESPSETLRR